MKKLYFLILGGSKVKISYLLLAFLFATTTAATAEVLLNENFEYEVGYLYNQGGWVKYSSHAKDSIRVVNTPLTYDGYQTTPIGKAVRIGSSDTQGQDLMKHFCDTGFVKANSFYLAALVNIEQAGTNYFLTLVDSASYAFADGKAPTEKLRLLATPNSENDNQFYFEIAKGNASSVKTTQAYELHTTYWVVIKYEFIIAATDSATTKTDDKILLYINPTSTTTPTESSANAILSGDILNAPTKKIPFFNFEVPTELPGVDTNILDPRDTYADASEWDTKAKDLAQRFIKNFAKCEGNEAGKALVEAGPQL